MNRVNTLIAQSSSRSSSCTSHTVLKLEGGLHIVSAVGHRDDTTTCFIRSAASFALLFLWLNFLLVCNDCRLLQRVTFSRCCRLSFVHNVYSLRFITVCYWYVMLLISFAVATRDWRVSVTGILRAWTTSEFHFGFNVTSILGAQELWGQFIRI